MKQLRNIGIFAHVDAGKTTLSEQLLAHAGAIRVKGSVDAGTAHTDKLDIERRRGISVKATSVSFTYNNTQINMIDTPGHADFAAEVERSLWAMDAAVLVVCAVEGVQPQTEVLFSAMRKQNIPIIFFLNKTDRVGADPDHVLKQIHRLLTKNAVMLSDHDAVTELLCDHDDDLLERYYAGEVFDPAYLRQKLAPFTKNCKAYPVLAGSALRGEGVIPLLDAIVEQFPSPACSEQLSGVVFSAQQDRAMGRGVWIRLFGGVLETRDAINLPSGLDPSTGEPKTEPHKITQIMDLDGHPVGKLSSGEIGIVYGLGDIPIGHVLGDPDLLPHKVEPGNLCTPLITVQVIPEKPEQMTTLRQACSILSGEDPLLKVQYIRSLNELHMQIMGMIQLEILEELLASRFDIKVRFSPPAIIYRETIAQKSEGYVAYLAPKPCWAILRFEIAPGAPGSGVTFRSTVPVRTLKTHYQNQVAQAIPLALNQGRLGWQVTDVVITLIDGGDHQYHTHPLDFIVATPMAIQDGLQNGGSVLLEPILDVRFLLPPDCVGRVMSDVMTMRGEVLHNISDGERTILIARIPVQTSLDYSVKLATATGGRGTMSVKLHGYKPCPIELGAVAKRRSVDPLDTSKYILAARSALEGSIFDTE